jgi:hypothetical protein
MVVIEPCRGVLCVLGGSVLTLRRPKLFFLCLTSACSISSSSLRCVSTVMTLSPIAKTCTMASDESVESRRGRLVGTCSGSCSVVAECVRECSYIEAFGLDRWWLCGCPSTDTCALSVVSGATSRGESTLDILLRADRAMLSTWETVRLKTRLRVNLLTK